MISRRKRNLFLQKLFWNPMGFKILRFYVQIRRRVDYVLLNHSLDSETNGEYWLLDNLPTNAVVLDVGFNMGDYTEQVLQRCPTATVHAFDPARAIQAVYEERFSSDSRIHFYPIALSNEAGELEFYDYNNECSSLTRRVDAGEEKECYKVSVQTLDSWFKEQGIDKIDLLKVDAEGFDANVLEGTVALLEAKKIGAIMFEYASGWIGNRRFLGDVAKLIEPTEYRMFQLFNGFLAPFEYDVAYESSKGRMYVLLPAKSWASHLKVCPMARID
jgi:FkbM family methyltransferase